MGHADMIVPEALIGIDDGGIAPLGQSSTTVTARGIRFRLHPLRLVQCFYPTLLHNINILEIESQL